MFTISASIKIARPATEVFGFVADHRNDPQWRQGVVSMQTEPAGPSALGTITTERMAMLGSTNTTVAEITEFVAGSRVAFRSRTGAVPCHGFRHVEVAGDGARVTYSLTLEMSGIMRLLSVVLRPLLERQVGGDMRRLKALLEGQRYT